MQRRIRFGISLIGSADVQKGAAGAKRSQSTKKLFSNCHMQHCRRGTQAYNSLVAPMNKLPARVLQCVACPTCDIDRLRIRLTSAVNLKNTRVLVRNIRLDVGWCYKPGCLAGSARSESCSESSQTVLFYRSLSPDRIVLVLITEFRVNGRISQLF